MIKSDNPCNYIPKIICTCQKCKREVAIEPHYYDDFGPICMRCLINNLDVPKEVRLR